MHKIKPFLFLGVLLLFWQFLTFFEIVPSFMLPSISDVIKAFIADFSLLMENLQTTLLEAFIGLGISVLLAFVFSVLMDRYEGFYQGLYPIVVLSQTIPTVAIAPLLVLWLGYGMTPKVVLIVIVCFFPMTLNLLEGLRSVDPDMLVLMKTMNTSYLKVLWHVKLPASLGAFFTGLKIAVSYAVVGAVIAEWLGGTSGLGVYMTRVRKSYAYDKMFAVIILTSIISLLLLLVVSSIQKKVMPWSVLDDKKEDERT